MKEQHEEIEFSNVSGKYKPGQPIMQMLVQELEEQGRTTELKKLEKLLRSLPRGTK